MLSPATGHSAAHTPTMTCLLLCMMLACSRKQAPLQAHMPMLCGVPSRVYALPTTQHTHLVEADFRVLHVHKLWMGCHTQELGWVLAAEAIHRLHAGTGSGSQVSVCDVTMTAHSGDNLSCRCPRIISPLCKAV